MKSLLRTTACIFAVAFALLLTAQSLPAQVATRVDTVYVVQRVYERQPLRPGCRHSTPQFCNGYPGSNYDPYPLGSVLIVGLTAAELLRPGGLQFFRGPSNVARRRVVLPPVAPRSRPQPRP